MTITSESEKRFVRACASLGSWVNAGLEVGYSKSGARDLKGRLGLEGGLPPGRPQAGSFSDHMALATLIIEGKLATQANNYLRERISESTVFRILSSVVKEKPRFVGVAAVISHSQDDRQILLCREQYARRHYFKRVGDVTVPMGFANARKTTEANLRGLVWSEVFSEAPLVKNNWWENSLELVSPQPLATFQIVDCAVAVYHLRLRVDPQDLGGFTSEKTTGHQWLNVNQVLQLGEKDDNDFHLRFGVAEMLNSYMNYLVNPQYIGWKNEGLASSQPSQLNRLLKEILSERKRPNLASQAAV